VNPYFGPLGFLEVMYFIRSSSTEIWNQLCHQISMYGMYVMTSAFGVWPGNEAVHVQSGPPAGI